MKYLLAFIFSLVIAKSLLAEDPAKYEYKIWLQPDDMYIESSSNSIEKKLNTLGEDGWELISVVWKKHSDNTVAKGRFVYYFKRIKAVIEPIKRKVHKSDVLEMSLLVSGKMQLNGENITKEQFLEKLSNSNDQVTMSTIRLYVAKDVLLEKVLGTDKWLKNIGFESVALISPSLENKIE